MSKKKKPQLGLISLGDARKIILHAAGLAKHGQFGKGKEGVYKAIAHLGFIQIDTNYVVERAHHHALAARVRDYQKEWPDELIDEGRVFEFWTFATGYIPTTDFRFSLPRKQSYAERWKPKNANESALMRKVLDRIGREGPLMARDFENDRVTKSTGWWDWRPSKVALERLFMSGQLMITRRKDFQKVYDLAANLAPRNEEQSMPTDEEFCRHVIRRALGTLGIAYSKEIFWTARYVKSNLKVMLEQMVATGEVRQVKVEGLERAQLYALPETLQKPVKLNDDIFILSPFDILNVFRHRLRDFFQFDYQVECFVPEAKRKYGYFVLPILEGDRFIARMDSKADRKNGVLLILNLHFEHTKFSKGSAEKFASELKRYMKFNDCQSIELVKTNDRKKAKEVWNYLLN